MFTIYHFCYSLRMVKADELYDITVIGAGPVGLYAAYYAGLRECRTKLIETYPQVGGRLISMYPEKEIFDVAGHRRIVAADLIRELTDQAMQYRPAVVLNERVTGLRILGERVIELTTPAGIHYTQTAILAAGCGAFVPRKLDIPHLIDFEGHGIFYFLPSFEPLRGKKVLIVGGGNSAVDWALSLDGIASEVTLCHRMYKWQAHEAMVHRLLSSNVRVKYPYFTLKSVLGEEKVTGAVIWNERSGLEETIAVDAIVLSIGMLTNIEPFREWGLNIVGSGIAVAPDMSTNLPGVYAAGDIVTYPGKVLLITAGSGEAATAVNTAKEYILSDELGGKRSRLGGRGSVRGSPCDEPARLRPNCAPPPAATPPDLAPVPLLAERLGAVGEDADGAGGDQRERLRRVVDRVRQERDAGRRDLPEAQDGEEPAGRVDRRESVAETEGEVGRRRAAGDQSARDPGKKFPRGEALAAQPRRQEKLPSVARLR